MSFPRYPAYKDSGIEWLGNLPAHWGVMSLVRDIEFITSGARGWAENYSDDGDLFIRIGNLTRDSINLDLSDVQRVLVPASAEVNRTHVQSGDVLFSITAYLGSVAVVPPGLGKAFVSQHVALVRPKQRHCISTWIGYLAISHVGKTHLETTGYGGTKVQLSLADVTTMPVVVPPKDEQTQIVGFLDRETAKIDALVAEQEQLITLLKEKRQAVISHAVTKGLDPSVPMKDSGVEWLGEVPAHWGVAQFRRHVAIAEGQVNPEDSPYSEMVLIAPNHVESATGRLIAQETAAEQGAESGKYLCAQGDVIYSKIRPALRKACLAPVDCLCSADMYPLKPHSGLKSDFLLWYMLSEGFSTLAVLESERVAMPKINRETLNPVPLIIPPEDEQHSISVYLSAKTDEFDRLTAEATDAIALLQERRSALISAAVTGQIDVRGLAPAQAQAA